MIGRKLLPTKNHACFTNDDVSLFTLIEDPKIHRVFFYHTFLSYGIHILQLLQTQVIILWKQMLFTQDARYNCD